MANPAPLTYSAAATPMAAGRYIVPQWVRDMPVMTWAPITGTDLSTSSARMPYSDGTFAHQGVVNGWGGWAINPANYDVFLTGGGHSDGADNSIYKINLKADAPAWVREADGSAVADRVRFQTPNNGGAALHHSKWNLDQKPVAAHVYNNMQFINGRLFRNGFYQDFGASLAYALAFAPNNEGWLHGYNTVAHAWDDPTAWALMPSWKPADPASGGGGGYNRCCTDGSYYYSVIQDWVGSAGQTRVMRFDPVANTWTPVGPDIAGDPHAVGYGGCCYDAERHQLVRIIEKTARIYLYDLATGLRTTPELTGPNASFAVGWDSSYMGVAHDTRRDVYYAYSGMSGHGQAIYRIDPNNNYYTDIVSVTGAPVASVGGGINSRLKYLHRYDAIVIQPAYAAALWALRMS